MAIGMNASVAKHETIDRYQRHSWLRPTILPALLALVVLVIGGVYLD